MKLTKKQIKTFQKEILEWYRKNKRNLPWRENKDPYRILISEVMLQQTQVSRVIPKFDSWMKKFPTIQDLARASTRDVLLLWSGLGYNRRALYLKRCAEELVKRSQFMVHSRKPSPQPSYHKGTTFAERSPTRDEGDQSVLFPRMEKELRKLPGIGEYTARAILCFAFDKQIAVVDTNVRKVILTKFRDVILNDSEGYILRFTQNDKKRLPRPRQVGLAMTNNEIQEVADQLLPKGRPARIATQSVAGGAYEWNQALMDYAAAELKKEKIFIPKQSKFKDSDRYYRGQILKMLLEKKKITKQELFTLFKKKLTKERLERILQGLIKESFIKGEKGEVSLD